MPRAGWAAAGAVAAAMACSDATRAGAVAVLLGAAAAVLATWLVTLAGRPGASGRASGARRAALATRFMAIGFMLVAARSAAMPAAADVASRPLPSGDGPWPAVVESIGAPKAGQQPAIVVLDAPATVRLAATLPVYPLVVPGDHVTMSGPLRPPPTDDPYGEYLARIGAAGTIRVSSVVVDPPGDDHGRILEGLRRGADRAIRLAVPEPEAGLASGVLIGLRDRVDRDLSAAFTAVGATHVVAISGWNIAIVATTLAAVAGRLARRRRATLTALAIVGYVVFVGPSPSVVRAAAMAGVVMLARELGRPSRAAAAIGWAIAALLLVDPHMVHDIGFQLSALATIGLIVWGTPFSTRLAGSSPGRARSWLAESLGISLAAQLATLPVVVLAFGRLSLVSPVVNLGVVPLVAPAMAAGVVGLGGGLLSMAGLPPAVAVVLGLPGWLLFSLMVGVVRAGARLPFASVALGEPWNAVGAGVAAIGIVDATWWTRSQGSADRRETAGDGGSRSGSTAAGTAAAGSAALGSAAAGSAADLRHRRPEARSWWVGRAGRLAVGGLAASVVAMTVVVVHRPDGTPRVAVLDVGQGDAILVEGGRGGRLLIDGGPDPGRLLVALDEHLPPWDRRIDIVILSHPHEDHAAGLAALLDRYEVRKVLEPGMFGPGPGYAALNAELQDLGIARGTLATGDRLTVDEFRFQVLWPDPGTVPQRAPDTGTAINNVSIVLLGEVNRHRILLAGDIEEQIDPTLLARGLPAVDLLKVAHHGSRTSSTEPFLEATRPGVAVISAGRGNPYGHPAPATVARLEGIGAEVRRTDLNGTVTVDLGVGHLRVRSSGARASNAAPSSARTAGLRPGPGVPASWLCAIPLPSLGIVALPAPTTPEIPPSPIAGLGQVSRVASALLADSSPRLRYDAARDPRLPDRRRTGVPAAVLIEERRPVRVARGVAPTRA